MSFRLWTILYAFALLAAAMTTFGPLPGIGIAGTALLFWIALRNEGPRRSTLRTLLLFTVFGWSLLMLVLAAASGRSASADRNGCKNNLRTIALALLTYRNANGTLPPACTVDATGQPLVSWRAVLLPYLEISGLQTLDASKSWTDRANLAAASASLPDYCCPSYPQPSTDTQYFAIVDSRTVWGNERKDNVPRSQRDLETTIMLIEDGRPSINWAEPRDLSFDEAMELLTKPTAPEDGHPSESGLLHQRCSGINVAFEDGHVSTIYPPLSRQFASALLSTDADKRIDPTDLMNATRPKLDYARCYALGMFLVLCVLPAAKLKRVKPEHVAC